MGVRVPPLLDGEEVLAELSSTVSPSTAVLDRDGTTVEVMIGMASEARLEGAVRPLL